VENKNNAIFDNLRHQIHQRLNKHSIFLNNARAALYQVRFFPKTNKNYLPSTPTSKNTDLTNRTSELQN